jgi:hypothetical protein
MCNLRFLFLITPNIQAISFLRVWRWAENENNAHPEYQWTVPSNSEPEHTLVNSLIYNVSHLTPIGIALTALD